jgi:hypothetical protein
MGAGASTLTPLSRQGLLAYTERIRLKHRHPVANGALTRGSFAVRLM